MERQKVNKLFWGALTLAILLFGTVAVLPRVAPTPPASALQSDKYDGDCTGNETAGRCADKCPAGSYNIGISKDGSAICKLEPTGCPYGDSIPLGADCDKHAPVEPEIVPVQEYPVMEGK